MNGGSTFVLRPAAERSAGCKMSRLSLRPRHRDPPGIALDGNATLNGIESYTFLSWTTSGPAAGVQSNWAVGGASTITWAGTGNGVNWSNTANWSGVNVTGGTVQAVSTGGNTGYLEVSGLSAAANGPQAGSNVFIQSPAGATVTGPTATSSILSLTLGSTSGSREHAQSQPAARWPLPARPARRSTPRAC